MAVSRENSETTDHKELILAQLEKLGKNRKYLWWTFLLCLTPSIFNGFHASSYVFLTELPRDFWCTVPELADLPAAQIRAITLPKLESVDQHCLILNRNYSELFANSSAAEVTHMLQNEVSEPDLVKCGSISGSFFQYNITPGISTVPEWDLVCDRKLWRTNIQMALAVGKFTGAFVIGIIADRYGRKSAVVLSVLLYILAGPLSFWTSSYWLFFLARYLLGVAGAGVYHSAYTILTEVASQNNRAWISTVYSIAYPLGSCILAVIAYHIRDWRHLQAALTLPTIFLILNIVYLDESPRWLLNKGRIAEAARIVFRGKTTLGTAPEIVRTPPVETTPKRSFWHKLSASMHEMSKLYGTKVMRNRLLVCQFGWFVVSFAYYAIALNVDNMEVDSYTYIFMMGLFEIPSCFITIAILKYFGRKSTSLMLLVLSGISLLALLGISQDEGNTIMIIALFGRFCVASAFIVVILHTAELFPTEVRNTAIGTSSMMAHVGTISAPYVVDLLGAYAWYIPTTICAVLSLAAGVLIMILPETKNQVLLDKVDEVVKYGSESSRF